MLFVSKTSVLNFYFEYAKSTQSFRSGFTAVGSFFNRLQLSLLWRRFFPVYLIYQCRPYTIPIRSPCMFKPSNFRYFHKLNTSTLQFIIRIDFFPLFCPVVENGFIHFLQDFPLEVIRLPRSPSVEAQVSKPYFAFNIIIYKNNKNSILF